MWYKVLNELFYEVIEKVEVEFKFGGDSLILSGLIYFENNWLELIVEEEEEVELILYCYYWKGFRKCKVFFDI